MRVSSVLLVAFVGACSSTTTTSSEPSPDPSPSTPPTSETTPPPAEGGTTPSETAKSSGGSGGIACDLNESLVSGRKVCVAKLGGVEVKIVEPAKGTGPLRLAVYLHGDGAGAHKSGSALNTMVPWLDEKHGLGVSLLAPNGCAWWQKPSYDCSGSGNEPDVGAENSKALLLAFQALYAKFDIRFDGVAYYGSSGGSIFLTDEWLPLHGAKYHGVFALMCGGRAPRQAFAWDTTDATLVAKMPLFFTYGDQDHLVPQIGESIGAFEGKKFSVTKKVIAGAQHCAFNSHAEAVAIWQTAF